MLVEEFLRGTAHHKCRRQDALSLPSSRGAGQLLPTHAHLHTIDQGFKGQEDTRAGKEMSGIIFWIGIRKR
jgi:hypothetical protein